MAELVIGGRAYLVVDVVIRSGGSLQVYNCGQCSALVTNPELHNRWHDDG